MGALVFLFLEYSSIPQQPWQIGRQGCQASRASPLELVGDPSSHDGWFGAADAIVGRFDHIGTPARRLHDFLLVADPNWASLYDTTT